jgi:hypothetical protein
MVIRYNFIRDVTKKRVTMGDGIVISGQNNDSFGMRTGFRIYGNIIVNAERAGISSNNKDLVEIYHNVICRCGIGLRLSIMDAPLAGAVHNNIIFDPCEYFVHVYADTNEPWDNVSWDNNLYYPTPHQTEKFLTALTGRSTFSEYRRILGWDMNSLTEDPRFVSEGLQQPEDFRLQEGSPAIDAGKDVGIGEDFGGAAVPCGAAPDIGAYEYGASGGNHDWQDHGELIEACAHLEDYAVLARSWMRGCCSELNLWCEAADLNRDGFVDYFDLRAFTTRFLPCLDGTPKNEVGN